MKKGSYNWIWKWHMIGGLVSFPVVFILAVSGIIYLFKDHYEEPRHAEVKEVEILDKRLTYQEQLDIAGKSWSRKINGMVIPMKSNQATEFVSGRFSNRSSLFVDPYIGEVTGEIVVKNTDMYKIRKLHGELLTGSFGTKIIELVGSWMIVLIITGLFLFVPRKKRDWVKLFRVRINGPKHVLYRDLHMVGGFWFSIVLLLVLAGGMPWTDVWGEGFKWVQKQTKTGYPPSWQGHGINSTIQEKAVPIDDIVRYAKILDLPGVVTISVPESPSGVYSLHNSYNKDLSKQVALHLDQYSGLPVVSLEWKDVGFLIRARMWAMAFHQGQFGFWNWLLILLTAISLGILSLAAVLSYFLQKKTSFSGTLPRPESYSVGAGLYLLLGILGLLFPLFGVSILLIWIVDRSQKLKKRGIKT